MIDLRILTFSWITSFLLFNIISISIADSIDIITDESRRNSATNLSQLPHSSAHLNSSTVPRNRTERGLMLNEEDHEHEHEHHHKFIEEFKIPGKYEYKPPQYIIKLVAPKHHHHKHHHKEGGIHELLLILAPLTAIPLIGSLALTTFTALFASGAYGRRRKRNIVSKQLQNSSFTDLQTLLDQYKDQTLIANEYRDWKVSNNSVRSFNGNENGHSLRRDDNGWQTLDSSAGHLTPNSQVMRVKVSDKSKFWHPIDKVDMTKGVGKREIQELDIIQKYLNKMGRPDYNDEIIATYLSCNGMLSANNHCLERLTCQFSDSTSGMKQLEKDVSSLVIYSLMKNDHIDKEFKTRLQKAAVFGRDTPGSCNFYNCPKINDSSKKNKTRR